MTANARELVQNAITARGNRNREEAVRLLRQALQIDPSNSRAYLILGEIQGTLGQYVEAEANLVKSTTLNSQDYQAFNALGALLSRMPKRFTESEEAFQRGLRLNPTHVSSLYNYANLLLAWGRTDDAIRLLEEALINDPNHILSLNALSFNKKKLCDWSQYNALEERILKQIAGGKSVTPFATLSMQCSNEQLYNAASTYAYNLQIHPTQQLTTHCADPDRRIRIGYLSRDFFNHATAALIVELFEKHDRSRFEIYAYCYSPEDGSSLRQRIISSVDKLVRIHSLSDQEAARAINADRVDILVDLKGYTTSSRSPILAYRPAPVQVNYLGYPGTMGGDFVDYILGDRWVTPFDQQHCFAERIVQLPACYQPNDRSRVVAEARNRADWGLRPDAFVFCCFNNPYKITPYIFSVWMAILGATPNSQLWLFSKNVETQNNLRREAEKLGVSSDRLIFANPVAMPEHVARISLADLFLDTIPYNAHTTASETLWAGTPVITLPGKTFAGRVCASILEAAGLSEFIVDSIEDYKALAIRMAHNPNEVARTKQRIRTTIQQSPLFDTDTLAYNIELAYKHMWDRYEAGLAPAQFAVADIAVKEEPRGMERATANWPHTPHVEDQAHIRERRESVAELLQLDRETIIVDVGANPIGRPQAYSSMLAEGLCRVIGFEPQQHALDTLNAVKGPLEIYLPYIVADGNPHRLRICKASGMTSLLEPDPVKLSLFPKFSMFGEVIREEDVETVRLDDIKEVNSFDFLRMDIQGAELMLLENSVSKLAHCVAVQAEVSFVTLYKAQPTFGEVDAELRRQGFMPHWFENVKTWGLGKDSDYVSRGRRGKQLLEADIVYIRDFTRSNNMTIEQWRQLAMLSHYVFKSDDLFLLSVRALVAKGAIPNAKLAKIFSLLAKD